MRDGLAHIILFNLLPVDGLNFDLSPFEMEASASVDPLAQGSEPDVVN